MADWVDFAEVRQRVSLEHVLFDLYNLASLRRTGDKLVGPCPVHGGNSPRAFHADLEKNVWHCFSQCKRGGNQLDLVAAKEGISIREAALLLQRRFMEGPRRASTPTKKKKADRRKPPAPANEDVEKDRAVAATEANRPIDIRLQLKRDHPHLLKERALSIATLDEFGAGYCSRGLMRGCIAIPIHNASGELVAYAGRRLKPSDIAERGKYKLPKGFRKDVELYNWHRAAAHVAELGHVVVVEGFFSAMKLSQAGIRNVVATMGCSASNEQLACLSTVPELVVIYDGNEAGRGGARQIANALDQQTAVRLALLPEGFEPEGLPPRALRWLINGMRVLNLRSVEFQFNDSADKGAKEEV